MGEAIANLVEHTDPDDVYRQDLLDHHLFYHEGHRACKK